MPPHLVHRSPCTHQSLYTEPPHLRDGAPNPVDEPMYPGGRAEVPEASGAGPEGHHGDRRHRRHYRSAMPAASSPRSIALPSHHEQLRLAPASSAVSAGAPPAASCRARTLCGPRCTAAGAACLQRRWRHIPGRRCCTVTLTAAPASCQYC